MASVQSSSSTLSTYFYGISALLLCFVLFAGVDGQSGIDEVDALSNWASIVLSPPPLALVLGNPSLWQQPTGGYWASWNSSDENPCAWVGVTCTANFTVEALDLSGWGLHQLPSLADLAVLKDLRQLDLSYNDISALNIGEGSYGTLPDDVGSLTQLTHLDLSRSGFTGIIPANIANCTSLRYLSLGQNQLYGSIPSLLGLANLQVLILADNQLNGSFPELDLSESSRLVGADLSNNSLSGSIPSLSNFTRLTVLKLDNNNFTRFAESWLPTRSLENLFIYENELEGTIPPSIGSLTNLQLLDMSRNKFSGGIPSSIFERFSDSLLSLDFSQNKLTGNIPANFMQHMQMDSTASINLSHNLLIGNIPFKDNQSFPGGGFFDLSYNNLTGSISFPVFTPAQQVLPLVTIARIGLTSLRLQNNFLSGDLPTALASVNSSTPGSSWPAWQLLTELRLDNNFFTGDLSRILNVWPMFSSLQNLDLSNNNLRMISTEAIPDPLGAMLQSFNAKAPFAVDVDQLVEFRAAGNNFSGIALPTAPCFVNKTFEAINTSVSPIAVLDLSNNQLKGEISSTYNETCLPYLKFLNLSINHVSGPVPESIVMLPDLVVLDLSNNCLSGHLPFIQTTSGLFDPRIFAGNCGLCGGPLPPCSSNTTSVQWWVLLISIGASVISILASFLIAVWRWRVYRKMHEQDADLINTLMERESATLMSLRELKKATDNFAKTAQIGEGGFGTVYLGKLNDGTKVAIKKSKQEGSEKDKVQFLNEVRILSQVNHRHLVKLLGCCMENKTALLVFEFVPNGTLQEHLQGKHGYMCLSWKQRLNIAAQTADALTYLHSATKFPIYHRDVKSANILLDEYANAKVADFGISKLAPTQATHVSTLAVEGTMGYIDPEYYISYKLTSKSDVYSFGVVLLEIISAKLPIDYLQDGEETSLVLFARPRIKRGDLEQLIDPALKGTYDDIHGGGRDSILKVGRLAIKCLDMHSKARPDMNEVWKVLQDLWVQINNGTHDHLDYIDEYDSKALEYPEMEVLSGSLSGGSTDFMVEGDASAYIEMSHFSS